MTVKMPVANRLAIKKRLRIKPVEGGGAPPLTTHRWPLTSDHSPLTIPLSKSCGKSEFFAQSNAKQKVENNTFIAL